MTIFYAAPDAHGCETLWAKDQPVFRGDSTTFDTRDVPILRKIELAPNVRRFWDEIVQRMTVTSEAKAALDAAPGYRIEDTKRSGMPFDSFPLKSELQHRPVMVRLAQVRRHSRRGFF